MLRELALEQAEYPQASLRGGELAGLDESLQAESGGDYFDDESEDGLDGDQLGDDEDDEFEDDDFAGDGSSDDSGEFADDSDEPDAPSKRDH
jgi:hypothetical protein